jgi:O-antigen/teichoic acid export membrane protein
MTLKKCLLGGACLSLQPLVLNALSLPVMALIIRALGPTSFGQWTMATSLIGALGIITNLGLRGAFIRHITHDPHSASSALAEQLGLRLILASAAAALAIILCLILNYPSIITACVAVAACAMILTTFATTLIDVLQATHRTPTVAAINLTAGLVLTAASIMVIWLGKGPLGLSLAYLAGPLTSVLATFILIRRDMPIRIRCHPRNAARLLMRSRAFTAQQLLNSAPSYLDALLLPRLVGVTGFGFYTAGTLLPTRLAVVPDGLCTAAYPLLIQQFRDRPALAFRSAFLHLLMVTAACVFIALAITAAAGPIAQVLFPRQPAICRQVILLTIWALPLFGIETSLGYALNASGAAAAQARALFPATLANIFLTIILMAQLGLAGACIAIPLRFTVRIIALATCFVRSLIADKQHYAPAPSFVGG